MSGYAAQEGLLFWRGPSGRRVYVQTGDAVVQRLERNRGIYRYELKNFRGDVRQIISDIKHREDSNNDNVVDFYSSNVIQVTDGYSFGWDIAERSFTVDDHRFGFNDERTIPVGVNVLRTFK